MANAISTALLLTSMVAIIAECVAVAAPGRILEMMQQSPEHMCKNRMFYVAGVLSVFYMAEIILLFLSGDSRFRIYAMVLVALSLALWALKPLVMRFRFIMTVDSVVCLVILIDVTRTLVRQL